MSNLDNNLFIDTPENLLLEAQVAGFGGRCIAAMIDYVIMYAVMLLFGCLFARSIIYESESSRWAWGILILLQFVVFFFYHLIFEFAWNGQTPGKRRMGLRVIQANGLPLTTSGLLIRNFVRLVDFLPLFYGFGLLSFFVTKRTQRLGDLAAQTLVIYEYKQLTLKSLREDYTIQYFFVEVRDPLPPYIKLDALTQTDRRVIVDYLQRRWDFTTTRPYLVLPMAARLADAMGVSTLLQLNTVQSAETFLEQIARAFELDERGQWPPKPAPLSQPAASPTETPVQSAPPARQPASPPARDVMDEIRQMRAVAKSDAQSPRPTQTHWQGFKTGDNSVIKPLAEVDEATNTPESDDSPIKPPPPLPFPDDDSAE